MVETFNQTICYPRSMRQPDQEFYLPTLRGPIVYAFCDDDRQPLYIGMSTKGLGRPFNPHHHIGQRGTILKVWFCKNQYEAVELEAKLISTLNPPLNIQMNNGPSRPDRMVEKVNQIVVEKFNDRLVAPVSSTSPQRLPGHGVGCGCLPEDWRETSEA